MFEGSLAVDGCGTEEGPETGDGASKPAGDGHSMESDACGSVTAPCMSGSVYDV